jgi:hypothetical protein
MQWNEKWRVISARIDGLVKSGELLALMLKINSSDARGVVRKSLMPELDSIVAEIRRFGEEYGSCLPEAAAVTLDRFLGQDWDKHMNDSTVDLKSVVPLAAFRSEFNFLLRDMELETRNLTELAFEHLRRMLEVDSEIQQKWQIAFKKRENHCERLGAVHLLSHGIGAFKITGVGAATDLVFGVPIEREIDLVRRTARALVLTEWKLIKDEKEMENVAAAARKQTDLYAGGLLGDLELKRTRYIILVTSGNITAPGDVKAGSINFLHIVIPVAAEWPSTIARKRTGKTKTA